MDEKKQLGKKIEEKMLQGAAADTVQRFGSAVKEHLVALTGKDNELGKKLKKSLKSISESKVNDQYYNQNIKQQAGFSAEVKSSARASANARIKGIKESTIRFDDLKGSQNDPIIDICKIDSFGQMIKGSGAQMKFVGKSSDEMLEKLLSKKFHKYLEADVKLSVPDDFYEQLQGQGGKIDGKIKQLTEQLERTKADGKIEESNRIASKIEDCRRIKKNIRKSGLTNDEARIARKHPGLSTANDVGKVAVKAGLEQAAVGAAFAGGTSLVRNGVAYLKGEISGKELGINTAKDSVEGAAVSFATGATGSIIKGVMQNSSSEMIRSLSKTNLPASFVVLTKDVGKLVAKYMKGEISGAECIEQMGQQGFGELGASMYSTLATSAVKASASAGTKMVAGMVGSTCGYLAAMYVYETLSKSIKDYQFAKEQRILIEAECDEAIQLIEKYRMEMNVIVEEYLSDYWTQFDEGISAMDSAILTNDSEGFIASNIQIQEILGRKPQFRNQQEFDTLMSAEESFIL